MSRHRKLRGVASGEPAKKNCLPRKLTVAELQDTLCADGGTVQVHDWDQEELRSECAGL
jgi:hypothetical protein